MKKQTRGAPAVAAFLSLNLVISGILTGCSAIKNTTPVSLNGSYFDTAISITLYDYSGNSKDILDSCTDMCEYYENLLSSTVEGSDIWNINHATSYPVNISEDTAKLLYDALDICKISDGRIDITLGGISELWDFSSQAKSVHPVIPSDEEITEALKHVDYKNVILSTDSSGQTEVTLTDPQSQIELGFIAKGYIADKLKEYLESQEVKSALINLGGNIQTLGTKPDGSQFTIGIQKPFSSMGEYITQVKVSDSSVVSSGVYERCFYYNDILYHHILDAQTGYPADTGIYGVSIRCPSSKQADALSTLCLLLGKDDGIAYIETLPDTECMYITSDFQIISSSGW